MKGNLDFSAAAENPVWLPFLSHAGWGLHDWESNGQLLQGLCAPSEEFAPSCPKGWPQAVDIRLAWESA